MKNIFTAMVSSGGYTGSNTAPRITSNLELQRTLLPTCIIAMPTTLNKFVRETQK